MECESQKLMYVSSGVNDCQKSLNLLPPTLLITTESDESIDDGVLANDKFNSQIEVIYAKDDETDAGVKEEWKQIKSELIVGEIVVNSIPNEESHMQMEQIDAENDETVAEAMEEGWRQTKDELIGEDNGGEVANNVQKKESREEMEHDNVESDEADEKAVLEEEWRQVIYESICGKDGERQTVCDICGASLGNKGFFRIQANYPFEKRRFACGECMKGGYFRSEDGAYIKYQPYRCSVCGEGFSLMSVLRRHERSHFGTNRYVCKWCGKEFSKSLYLRNHEMIHKVAKPDTDDKPFVCDVCGKRLSRKVSLRNHEKTHGGERPFACEFCNKTFQRNETLKVHVLIHTGEKPYTCKACGRAFSQNGSMHRHIKRIHPALKYFPT